MGSSRGLEAVAGCLKATPTAGLRPTTGRNTAALSQAPLPRSGGA